MLGVDLQVERWKEDCNKGSRLGCVAGIPYSWTSKKQFILCARTAAQKVGISNQAATAPPPKTLLEELREATKVTFTLAGAGYDVCAALDKDATTQVQIKTLSHLCLLMNVTMLGVDVATLGRGQSLEMAELVDMDESNRRKHIAGHEWED